MYVVVNFFISGNFNVFFFGKGGGGMVMCAPLLDIFSFYVCLYQLSWNRSLGGDISLV